MLYETIEDYDNAIKRTREAMERIIDVGQTRSVEVGENKWSTTEAQLTTYRKHLSLLISEKKLLQKGSRANTTGGVCYVGAGW